MCGGLNICVPMCGHRYLRIEFNEETIGTVEYLIFQRKTDNMWWSNSFSFSLWMLSPVNRFKSRNKMELFSTASFR